MARTVLTAVLVAMLGVLVGCGSPDSGRSQLMPVRMKALPIIEAGEADLIEGMATNRQAYRQGLESLIAHYKKTGNNMKLGWAKDELARLNELPQYSYILEAGIAGPHLRAQASISLADYKYREAVWMEKKAKEMVIFYDEELLREALDRYNQLIEAHPTSDKIDDAAYGAGGICQYFKDYTIALLYYERAYQWDPKTTHPAKYRAARILDKQLSRRDEALELYQQVVEEEGLKASYKRLAKKRIAELTKSVETLE